MDRVSDIYWKTVAAGVATPAPDTAACLDRALVSLGFRRAVETEDGPAYRRTSWLALLPSRHEWRVSVTPLDTGSAFAVRIGLNNGGYTYGGLAASFAAAMACVVIASETRLLKLLWLAGVFFALPVVQGLAARFESHAMEGRLWPLLSSLGAWRDGRTIWRTLNRAYGRDRVVMHASGARP